MSLLLAICAVAVLLVALSSLFRQRINAQLAAVVVLGDIGRSPRCMYHAMSLVENGYEVVLIGYRGA